jgi:hypothetical protein
MHYQLILTGRTHSLHEKGVEFEEKKVKVPQKSSLAITKDPAGQLTHT